jgi:hypothetical protein
MANVIAYYGTAASCTKYSLDPIDWAAAQQRPDSGKWSLTPQSGTIVIDPSFQTFPLLVNYGTATFPNQHGWSPDTDGRGSSNTGYSGWGGGPG